MMNARPRARVCMCVCVCVCVRVCMCLCVYFFYQTMACKIRTYNVPVQTLPQCHNPGQPRLFYWRWMADIGRRTCHQARWAWMCSSCCRQLPLWDHTTGLHVNAYSLNHVWPHTKTTLKVNMWVAGL